VDTSFLKLFYLTHLSQPSSDRPVYRAMLRLRPRRILEIGIGDGRRAVRMLQLACRLSEGHMPQYIGVDVFEARSVGDGPGMSLRLAHRTLGSLGARVQLVPGDPHEALDRSANHIGPVDLLVVSAKIDADAMRRAWFYVPRLLHEASVVFREVASRGDHSAEMHALGGDEVAALAEAARPRVPRRTSQRRAA